MGKNCPLIMYGRGGCLTIKLPQICLGISLAFVVVVIPGKALVPKHYSCAAIVKNSMLIVVVSAMRFRRWCPNTFKSGCGRLLQMLLRDNKLLDRVAAQTVVCTAAFW